MVATGGLNLGACGIFEGYLPLSSSDQEPPSAYGTSAIAPAGKEMPKESAATTATSENSQLASTATLTATETTISESSGSLSGLVFHDFDGDGLKGEGEPPIANAILCFDDPEGELCVSSGDDGAYSFDQIPGGEQQLYVQSPNLSLEKTFRYTNRFIDWLELPAEMVWQNRAPAQRLPETSLQRIQEPLNVSIQPGAIFDIALMQGFLTDILACGVREKMTTFQGYDLDSRSSYVRHYYEDEARQDGNGKAQLKGDNHYAYDWGDLNQTIIGTPILAPANGIVTFAGEGQTWNGLCRLVQLVHPETGDSSGYVHLDTVLVKDRQQVQRGQVLGTMGMSCTTWPHVHFYFVPSWSPERTQYEGVDMFRDSADPESYTYWTVDNAPQCPTFAELP